MVLSNGMRTKHRLWNETHVWWRAGLGQIVWHEWGAFGEFRIFYDARDMTFNPKDRKPANVSENTVRREATHQMSSTITYVLDTETAQPAGVYLCDRWICNTILIAITCGGKGQTYINHIWCLDTGEKPVEYLFTTDPKGVSPACQGLWKNPTV